MPPHRPGAGSGLQSFSFRPGAWRRYRASTQIRVTTVLSPAESGDSVLGVGGTGGATLHIDDQLMVSFGHAAAHDVMGRGGQGQVARRRIVHGRVGRPVTVVVESQLGGARRRSPRPRCRNRVAGPCRRQSSWPQPPMPSSWWSGITRIISGKRRSGDHGIEQDQVDFVDHVTAANPRTVVVVNASGAVRMPSADRAAAVLLTWYQGEQLAAALTWVLLGEQDRKGGAADTIPMRDENMRAGGSVWGRTRR